MGPFLKTLASINSWKTNYTHAKLVDMITHPGLNSNNLNNRWSYIMDE